METLSADFFKRLYGQLRQQAPMTWMHRLFGQLIEGRSPSLVDLPTGSGKSDLVVIWLLALAWSAQDRARPPIPRRMVWVVNRRVLVQQVFDLAEQLSKALSSEDAGLEEVRSALRVLCRDGKGECLRLVQLRGQMVDDREWSLDPSVPQIIIGTVDQIGSRLLFQGYGCGKWARPLHAAWLGVDAWICLDEAHLVPAFALTLRQVRDYAVKPLSGEAEATLGPFFRSLPLWITELSATPALPRPPLDRIFTLAPEDEADPAIKDRLLAAKTRQVRFRWIADDKALADALVAEATQAAQGNRNVAIFCRTVATVLAVEKLLKKSFKEGVLKVTGRLRGYERDRLQHHPIFLRFRRPKPEAAQEPQTQPAFLIGTSAAEVGLDADADAIVCDFAPLPTLLQRLGRLDRRGKLSREARDEAAPVPAMTIVAVKAEDVGKHLKELRQLQGDLIAAGLTASFYTGEPWAAPLDKADVKTLVESATWNVLQPVESVATSPVMWLEHDLALITSGPVVVPALTTMVLAHWTATTPHPSRFLPVHSWLYGLLPDPEGTPLVGIAFRLELDLIQETESDEEEADGDEKSGSLDGRLLEILKQFSPLKAELHYVTLAEARDMLEKLKGTNLRIAHFAGDEWELTLDPKLRPDSILVLPTCVDPAILKDAFELDLADDELTTYHSDVLEAVSEKAARYRREIKIDGDSEEVSLLANKHDPAVLRFGDGEGASLQQVAAVKEEGSSRSSQRTLKGNIEGLGVTFTYRRKAAEHRAKQLLVDHLERAGASGKALAHALAPGNEFLEKLLIWAAANHDWGKSYGKAGERWQRAMGNSDLENPIAKTDSDFKPVVPSSGYRHESGSLAKMEGDRPTWPETVSPLAVDLGLHFVAAHHGYFRPSMPDRGLPLLPPSTRNALRTEAMERYARLQQELGPWRLAYLESLLKIADVDASQDQAEEIPDET